jgi:hypothetical protein
MSDLCAGAVAGMSCTEGEECLSGVCDTVCQPGAIGAGCRTDDDCTSANCMSELCAGAVQGTACTEGEECLSGVCEGESCQRGAIGAGCRTDNDCVSRNCDANLCAPGARGAICTSHDQCLSGDCYDASCLYGAADAACLGNSDCMSRSCTDGVCEPPLLVVQTEQTENVDDTYLDVIFRISNSGPSVAMSDLVFLYVYSPETVRAETPTTVESGIVSEDEVSVRSGPVATGTFAVCVEFLGSQSLETDSSSEKVYVQLQKDDSSPYDQTNDYSWPVASDIADFGADFRDNPRTVLCQRIDGAWRQVWGNTHPDWSDPCTSWQDL